MRVLGYDHVDTTGNCSNQHPDADESYCLDGQRPNPRSFNEDYCFQAKEKSKWIDPLEKSVLTEKNDDRDSHRRTAPHAVTADHEGYAALLPGPPCRPFSSGPRGSTNDTIHSDDSGEESNSTTPRRRMEKTKKKNNGFTMHVHTAGTVLAFALLVVLQLVPLVDTADPAQPSNSLPFPPTNNNNGGGGGERQRRFWWWQTTKATTTKPTTTTTTLPEVSTCRGIFCDGKNDGPCWCDAGPCCAADDTCRGILCDQKGDGKKRFI